MAYLIRKPDLVTRNQSVLPKPILWLGLGLLGLGACAKADVDGSMVGVGKGGSGAGGGFANFGGQNGGLLPLPCANDMCEDFPAAPIVDTGAEGTQGMISGAPGSSLGMPKEIWRNLAAHAPGGKVTLSVRLANGGTSKSSLSLPSKFPPFVEAYAIVYCSLQRPHGRNWRHQ